jgi:HK97 family phage major capsid protein
MDAEKKLKGLIEEVLSEKVKDQRDEILEEVNSKYDTVEERIAAIEAMPTKDNGKVQVEPEVAEPVYKGRTLDRMAKGFTYLKGEKKIDATKMMIDFIERVVTNGKAALNETSATQGGYLTFPEYMEELLSFARLTSVCLQKCRVMSVSTDSIHIPYEDTSVSTAFVNEAGSIGQSEPTVGELNLTPAKLAAYSICSNELLADSEFDILTWLTSLMGEAVGQKVDEEVFNGSTFTKLISASGITEVETSTNTTAGITIDFLAQVITSLASNKAVGAEFYMHRNGLRYLLALEDSVGNSIWTPAGGPTGAIWGIPVNIVEAFPSGVTGNDVFGIYGNLKHYLIAMRQGLEMTSDPYGLFTTDQTRFRGIMRVHGAPWDTSAFCQMKI